MSNSTDILKHAQEITFEGCGYCLISPEDRDDIVAEIERLAAELDLREKLIKEINARLIELWVEKCG